jgi:hypothetical protein
MDPGRASLCSSLVVLREGATNPEYLAGEATNHDVGVVSEKVPVPERGPGSTDTPESGIPSAWRTTPVPTFSTSLTVRDSVEASSTLSIPVGVS